MGNEKIVELSVVNFHQHRWFNGRMLDCHATGGDTHHYTTEDICAPNIHILQKNSLFLSNSLYFKQTNNSLTTHKHK